MHKPHPPRGLSTVCALAGMLWLLPSTGSLAESWQPYPADLPQFTFTNDQLEHRWDVLQRATLQEYPSTEWVITQLDNEGLCAATLTALKTHHDFAATTKDDCSSLDHALIATILQQTWRDYFVGNYEAATLDGEALGPIGYAVGGYARIIYAQALAGSSEEKAGVLKLAIEFAQAYDQIKPGSSYSLFIRAFSMGRIMEDLSLRAALGTGYSATLKPLLEDLVHDYPGHSMGSAAYGRYNAGIIDSSGRFLGRITYNATPEKMESGFATAMKVEPPVISSYLDYAIALKQVYGKDQLEKARQVVESMEGVEPLDAGEALESRRIPGLLRQLQSISPSH